MSFRDPKAITQAGIKTGETKARLSVDKILVASFLAGAYIAFGGLLAVTVSAGMDPEIWGTLPTFFTGAVFALGLVLVVIAGSELLTGNMALVPLAAMKGRVKLPELLRNLGWVTVGNLLGSLFVAYFLAVKTGVVTAELPLARLEEIAVKKGVEETETQIFLRALGCNWLVCLAVWMALAADDVAGKVLAIFFPIMGFVAMGFDHVVANMFFLPAAIFAGVDGLTWGDVLHNWLFAGLGNLVGAAVFVAGAYWYLYARDDEPEAQKGAGDTPSTGRFSRSGVDVDPSVAREAGQREVAVVGDADGEARRGSDRH
jgi:formate/nitrite transporter